MPDGAAVNAVITAAGRARRGADDAPPRWTSAPPCRPPPCPATRSPGPPRATAARTGPAPARPGPGRRDRLARNHLIDEAQARGSDPAAEMPGLVVALQAQAVPDDRKPITTVMLRVADWDSLISNS